MALAAGTSLGPYTILAPLGAGGMGEVYRAHDSRLDRDVAIKVLPPDVAQDAVRLERFAREARAAAALNHPNILAVHDVSSAGDVHYLVSELLEGQTLAERLLAGAGALAVRKAIDLAQQIAQGLGAAHARGIVHRDVKPANIFVTSDGRAKILDFGLAKQAALPDGGLTTTGDGRAPATDPGQVLGTVGYMAPEQVRGQALDARADIFAFGAVLYEMLAGRRAFHGDSAADTTSAILGKDPPDLVSGPDHLVPPALQRIVARCLEKDPAARFQSASDLAFALQALTSESTPSGTGVVAVPTAPARRAWREWAFGALALASVAAAVVSRSRGAVMTSPPVVAEFTVEMPRGLGGGIARAGLSPDGRSMLVYSVDKYWVHSLSDGSTVPFSAGTSRGGSIWSPDSSAFVYLATNGAQLVLYRLKERTSAVLAEVEQLAFPVTGAWSASGELVVADGAGRLLTLDVAQRRVRILKAAGGPPRVIAGFVPGTREFLSVNAAGPEASVGMFRSTTEGDFEERVDTGRWESAVVVDSTTVLAKLGSSIHEVRLDARTRRPVGEARIIVSNSPGGMLTWSASANGVLALAEVSAQQFHWSDRRGTRLGSVGQPTAWGNTFDMSADGASIVAPQRDDGAPATQNLWALDAKLGVAERLTFGSGWDSDPAILDGGAQIAFSSGERLAQTTQAFIVAPGQSAELAFDDPSGVALDDWSRDGAWFVYHNRSLQSLGTTVILAVPRDRSAPPRVVGRCERGIADEARVAPSGRWLAFNCNESGRHEIYVVPFPAGGSRLRVSRDGGVQPAWRGDDAELYFLGPDGTMMVAAMELHNEPSVAQVHALFETELVPSSANEQYRVTGDGQRFLMLMPAGPQRLRVIINWRERFKAGQPAQ